MAKFFPLVHSHLNYSNWKYELWKLHDWVMINDSTDATQTDLEWARPFCVEASRF